ncbi:MAG TPA: hypothetical protein VIK18_24525 [Pirellulales bacterium]
MNTHPESEFTNTVVLPAFDGVASLGLAPLVCRLDPPDREGCESWHFYDHVLYRYVRAKLDLVP